MSLNNKYNYRHKKTNLNYNYSKPLKRGKNYKRYMAFSLIILSLLIVVFAFVKPLPHITAQSNSITIPSIAGNQMPWPSTGNSAIGAQYFGPLLSNNDDSSVPIASTAKIFTALLVNNKNPIKGDGDKLVIDNHDVQIMQEYISKNGSILPVKIGQALTQKEAMQALLIVSANNIADTLAIKTFGSVDAYVSYANTTLKEWGFVNTNIADASGYSALTKSTASELVKAADMLISNPDLAQIVNTAQIESANIGIIQNTNKILGTNGVIGIKTGNTDEAGGCFVLAQKITLAEGQIVTMLVAVLNQYNVPDAIVQSLNLSQAASAGFAYKTIIPKDQVVNQYVTNWGESYDVVTKDDTKATIWQWKETVLPIESKILSVNHSINEPVGVIEVKSNNTSSTTQLVLNTKIEKPSIMWRFTNII